MHSTVAELMIFANHWVARRCLESFPERSCLRRHPPPRPEFFDELQRCAAARGLRVDIESNRALGQSLAAADDPKDPEVSASGCSGDEQNSRFSRMLLACDEA